MLVSTKKIVVQPVMLCLREKTGNNESVLICVGRQVRCSRP